MCSGKVHFRIKKLGIKIIFKQFNKKIFLKNNLIHKKYKYDIHGSDERQYSYPGNEINMLSIHKDKYEYKSIIHHLII